MANNRRPLVRPAGAVIRSSTSCTLARPNSARLTMEANQLKSEIMALQERFASLRGYL